MSYDPISFKIGLAMGHISPVRQFPKSEPVEPDEPTEPDVPIEPDEPVEPVMYLYNGVRLPELPSWTVGYKNVVILYEDQPKLVASDYVYSARGTKGNITVRWVEFRETQTSVYQDGKWADFVCEDTIGGIWIKETYSYVTTPDKITLNAFWSSEDLYYRTNDGEEVLIIEGSDPVPVYE